MDGPTTRGALARQQEDPMGYLILLVREQGERQEIQAAERRDQFRRLTKCFEDQYSRVREQQEETQERMNRLEEGLQGMGEMLEARMRTAEDGLGEVKNFQAEMHGIQNEKLQELKQMVLEFSQAAIDEGDPLEEEHDVGKGLQPSSAVKVEPGEMSGGTGSFLRPEASEFVPLKCVDEVTHAGARS